MIKVYKYFKFVLIFLMFIFTFWWITYMSDWDAYEHAFEYGQERLDKSLYGLLTVCFKHIESFSFRSLYRFYILGIAFLYLLFAKRITPHYFIPYLSLILVLYVPIANQIRFFLALPLLYFSIYYFFYKQNKVLAILILVIAAYSHKGVLPIFALSLLFGSYDNRFFCKIIVVNIVMAVSFPLIFRLIPSEYNTYFATDNLSGVMGGVFSLLPHCLCGLIIYFIHKKNRSNQLLNSDKLYWLIFRLCFLPFFFMALGIYLKVIISRYLAPTIFIWLLYMFYIRKYNYKFSYLISFLLILIQLTFLIILPLYLFGESDYLDKSILIINSFSK